MYRDIHGDFFVGDDLPCLSPVQGYAPDGGVLPEKGGYIVGPDILHVPVHAPGLEPAGSYHIPEGQVVADEESGIVPGWFAGSREAGEVKNDSHYLPELVPRVGIIEAPFKGYPAGKTAQDKSPGRTANYGRKPVLSQICR